MAAPHNWRGEFRGVGDDDFDDFRSRGNVSDAWRKSGLIRRISKRPFLFIGVFFLNLITGLVQDFFHMYVGHW